MKTMYEYLYPVGGKIWQDMPDDFPEGVPYTSVPPLQDIPLERQFWNAKERRWEEVVTQDVSEKLNLLETINNKNEEKIKVIQEENEALKIKTENLSKLNAKLMLNDLSMKEENEALKEKTESLAQINSKTMLASLQNSKDIDLIKQKLTANEGGK